MYFGRDCTPYKITAAIIIENYQNFEYTYLINGQQTQQEYVRTE